MSEYPPNRLIIIRNFFISLTFFAVLYYEVVSDRQLFFAVAVIVFVLFLPQTIKIFFSRIALKIDGNGITDYTRSMGFIPWSDIKGARIKTIFTSRVLELDLRDPSIVIDRQNFLWKALMNFNRGRGMTPSIAIAFVDCDADSVVRTINSHNTSQVSTSNIAEKPKEKEIRHHTHNDELSRTIYSYKNPLAMVPLLGFVAALVIWAPDMFRGATLKQEIASVLIYVICLPSMLYAVFSYKKIEGDVILTKLLGMKISSYDIRNTVRIYKHGYNHMVDNGLRDYIRGDTMFGTWTMEGKDGDRTTICNISRFNTNVLPILERVMERSRYKVDLDGDAWAKLKGIRW